jgi:hypothetical protein
MSQRAAVRTPVFEVIYAGVDITADMRPMVRQVTYRDTLHGASDEIEVEIEDRDGRWRGPWFPTKRDEIRLRYGYRREGLMDAGRFRVDQLDFKGGRKGDRLTIRAMSASVGQALRTRRTRDFEDTTLRGMVDRIAADHGLEVVGEIADIPFERQTQRDQEDLDYLTQLAEDYGYVVTVRDDRLVFAALADLAGQAPIRTVSPRDLDSWSVTDRAEGTYKAAEVRYQPPQSRETVTRTVTAPGIAADRVTAADTLRREIRVENQAQADARARALLQRENRKQRTGRLTLEGDPRLVAGANLALRGFGQLDGRVQIERAEHGLSDAGYGLELEVVHVDA